MTVKVGAFEVSTGKGCRIYISCEDPDAVSHPEELCKVKGLLVYGMDHAKDLAAAIIALERKLFDADSVEARAKQVSE